MKFGKEFAAQMVPEWQEAYMDYGKLKTLLKDILRFKQRNRPPATPSAGLKRKLTLYRAFSGLTQRYNHHPTSPSSTTRDDDHDIESQAILVNSVSRDGLQRYQTTFLMSDDEGGEYELVYFRRLDDEFNKVEKFYRSMVEEVMKEADMLNKQMDAFIAFRIKVENPRGLFDRSVEMTRLASNVAASAAALSASTSRGASAIMSMDVIEEVRSNSHGQSDDSGVQEKDEEETIDVGNQKVQEQRPNNIRASRPAPPEVVDRVKINNTRETPRSTIKNILHYPMQTKLNFSRKNLMKAEEQLKRAIIEFYQKLRLLKSFSFLNILAFSKIMKKYEKITSRDASKSYLKMVDNSILGSSDEVTKLMDRTEAAFIKYFSNSNRTRGMNILRSTAKRERQRTTFSMGLFAGATLILALILIIRARNLMNNKGATQYMENMFPLYSLFGFIVLHMLMYAANIYFWRRYRVNYSFIFGFKQGTELGYQQVLLLSFGLAALALALASVPLNLDMERDPKMNYYKALTDLLPLSLVLLVVIILLFPFNIMYRSSRFFFLTCLFHCICAPLYKVTLPDFFLADQFTSQVQALRSLEFYICYYGWGDYKHRQNTCKKSDVFNTFYFIVAVIPYLSRLLQCLHRLFEEKDAMQGYNALKYFLTSVAVTMRTAYKPDKGLGWRMLAWIFSAIAAIVSTYWDLVVDWGLLQRKSKNQWLRDKLLIPHKSVYFGAMLSKRLQLEKVLNVVLRFAWLQTVLGFKMSFLHGESLITIVAFLEIIRRGIWNFFRLENEHLNNVGKYRAFKSVPLPFNYDDNEDEEE
ncbi:hypothetical protein F2P56_024400 [Juglans regia]|uniref:Phosphate transporter PHO1 homolog 3-like n=2 Tax=Juglans regia TaxID=51240 RepID=A0A833TZV6_JUGRE|nr:phosphate transporter PHO1 homolog 3-like isoform X2 [Juglans regia]KAF5454757.1 hypothetical protein F2P56_024400 [Juglans regia]